MTCEELRESIEPFVDGELSVEMLNRIKLHTADCQDCADLIRGRERFDARLRNAFAADSRFAVDPVFVTRLRSEFGSETPRRSFFFFGQGWRVGFAAAMAAILLVTGGIYVAFRNDGRETSTAATSTAGNNSGVSVPTSVPASFRNLVNTAVEEHKSCTLTNLTSHHEPSKDLGSMFLGDRTFDKAVRAAVQAETHHEISTAASHFCETNGQVFRHLILREGLGFISVLVTDAGGTQQDENAIYCETVDGSPVACFKSQRKTVFVVSDRSEEANLKLAQSITPTVRSFLDKPAPFL